MMTYFGNKNNNEIICWELFQIIFLVSNLTKSLRLVGSSDFRPWPHGNDMDKMTALILLDSAMSRLILELSD